MLKKIMYHSLLLPIYLYRYMISPILGPRCRFAPTCSEYAIESILKYGVIKGVALTIKRLARCHHKGGSGYDPVP